jgi:hypothetical protein
LWSNACEGLGQQVEALSGIMNAVGDEQDDFGIERNP